MDEQGDKVARQGKGKRKGERGKGEEGNVGMHNLKKRWIILRVNQSVSSGEVVRVS